MKKKKLRSKLRKTENKLAKAREELKSLRSVARATGAAEGLRQPGEIDNEPVNTIH